MKVGTHDNDGHTVTTQGGEFPMSDYVPPAAGTPYPYASISDDALTEAAYAAYRDIDNLESSIRLGWTSAEVRQALAEAEAHLRELVEEANDRMHRQQLAAEQREDALRRIFGPPVPDPDLPF